MCIFSSLSPFLHLIWALLILNDFLVSFYPDIPASVFFLPFKGSRNISKWLSDIIQWELSLSTSSWTALNCVCFPSLVLQQEQPPTVPSANTWSPSLVISCSSYHILVSGLSPFCFQSLGLFQIPLASSPPRTIHSLSPWLCVSVLSSSLLFPPEVFELLKPFSFHTLPKIVLLFLLRSFLPLVICRDCSFCLLSPLLPWGPFPCCLLINVCQCPPFPSPNHFLKAHLFYKMQPFESCSLGLARSNSTLFDGVKPVQKQHNHCFHTWYSHRYPFYCNTKLCGADFHLCHRHPLRRWEAREEKWLDGFCASLISWPCMGKSGCGWVADVLHDMGHHPRCHNLFPSSLLLFQTCQSHSMAEKFKGCEFLPPQKPCAKQAFPHVEEAPDGPRWGVGLWAKAWLLIFA